MIRNSSGVIDSLFIAGNGISTKSQLTAYVPEKYASKGLAYIGSEVSVLGIMLLTLDHVHYGVTSCTTLLSLSPDRVESVEVDGEHFYKFTFNKGGRFIIDRFPKKDKTKVNAVFDYFYGYGHSPWWMSTVDLSDLLASTTYWNDMALSKSQITLDVVGAQVSRTAKDLKGFSRHTFKRATDALKPAITVPLRNGSLNRTSRLTMLTNTELKKGIRSAMLAEPVREEYLETLFMN